MGDDKETPFQYIIMQVREIRTYQYVQQATAKGKAFYKSRKHHSLLCVLRYNHAV